MFDINHGTAAELVGAVTTAGFGPMCAATSSFHVLGYVTDKDLFIAGTCAWNALPYMKLI